MNGVAMRRSRLRLAIYITSALLAAGGGVGVTVAATGPGAAASGVTATFSKDSDWGSGYQGKFTITNKGSAVITHWTVQFALPSTAKLGTFWDTAITSSGSTVTATDRGYNATVPAGSSTSFGFIVAGRGAPTSCTVNGAPCAGGGGGGPATATVGPPPPSPTPTPTKPAPSP